MKNIYKLGSSFRRPLDFYNSDGTPLDITGFTVTAVIKDSCKRKIADISVYSTSIDNLVMLEFKDSETWSAGLGLLEVTLTEDGEVIKTLYFPIQLED